MLYVDGDMYCVTMDDGKLYFCYYDEDKEVFKDSDTELEIPENSMKIKFVEEYK